MQLMEGHGEHCHRVSPHPSSRGFQGHSRTPPKTFLPVADTETMAAKGWDSGTLGFRASGPLCRTPDDSLISHLNHYEFRKGNVDNRGGGTASPEPELMATNAKAEREKPDRFPCTGFQLRTTPG